MLLKEALEGKSKQIDTANPSTAIHEVMDLLIEKNLCCLPVVDDEGRPVGIVSDLDILSAIHRVKGDYASLKVKDVMKAVSVVGKPDDDAAHVIDLLEKGNINYIPVVRSEKVIGLVSLQDIYRKSIKSMETEIRYLADMLHKRDKTGDYDSHY